MLAFVLASSCTDQALVDGQNEIAAEVRALRLAMAQAPANAPATAAPVLQREALTAALLPLREVLDGLAAQQRELETRQLALTQELQRWSQLLAQSVTGANRTETEALTARLVQLEAALKQQDARHQEVEKLIGGALDRTADRHEDFLRRLDGTTPATGSPAPVPTTPAKEATTGPGAPSPGNGEAGAGTRKTSALDPGLGSDLQMRKPRRDTTAWWIGLLGAAVAVGAVFAWRLARSPAPRPVHREQQPAAPGEGVDPGVEELWAAAAMLGEAVGRLKQGRDEGLDPDDVFVLDEGPPEPSAPVSSLPPPRLAAPVPPPPPTRPGPKAIHRRLPAQNPALAAQNVLRALADDPRVLCRPEPTATVLLDAVDVTFAVLPELSPGELSHLEQRLRDAV